MRLRRVDSEIIGAKLAHPVYNRAGMMYINNGVKIRENTLNSIKKLGITTVYIEDDNDIIMEEVLEIKKHLMLIKTLREEFENIQKEEKINDSIVKNIVIEIIDNINMSDNAYKCANIEIRDKIDELVIHSLDVTILAITIGFKMKYNRDKLINLGVGALLHDVGKLTSSKESHPISGLALARKNISIMPTSLTCIYQHHEYFDGTGYPQKLKGDNSYEFARVVSICNGYVNLLSKETKLPHEAIEEIVAKSINIYDKEIVSIFSSSINCYPNGLRVELSNGIEGVVIKQNKGFPQRPVLQVIKSDRKIDLLNELTFFVSEVSL